MRLQGLPNDVLIEEVQAFLAPELSVARESIRIGDTTRYVSIGWMDADRLMRDAGVRWVGTHVVDV